MVTNAVLIGLCLFGFAFLVVGGMFWLAWSAINEYSDDYDDWNDYR